MLSTLPPEILDLIVDHLHGEPPTLKACCVVSKSWVPRARRYLFADIKFSSSQPSFQSWTEAFPDPSNSPSHHTRSLSIRSDRAIDCATSTALRAWTHSFHHIIKLEMNLGYQDRWVSLVQLHGLSPTLKSLRLHRSYIPLSEVLNFVCSFPLLEDFWLYSRRVSTLNDTDEWDTPPTSPKFTGSLYLLGRIHSITRKLLDLPGGLHFTKISTFCPPGDFNSTTDLVSRCSDTLESLLVYYPYPRTQRLPPPLDLSKATKLKHLEFRWTRAEAQWITTTLQTVQSKNLQQITISSPRGTPVGETVHREWQDLDHLLARLWTSCSILPKVRFGKRRGSDGVGDPTLSLLPKLTSMGFVQVS